MQASTGTGPTWCSFSMDIGYSTFEQVRAKKFYPKLVYYESLVLAEGLNKHPNTPTSPTSYKCSIAYGDISLPPPLLPEACGRRKKLAAHHFSILGQNKLCASAYCLSTGLSQRFGWRLLLRIAEDTLASKHRPANRKLRTEGALLWGSFDSTVQLKLDHRIKAVQAIRTSCRSGQPCGRFVCHNPRSLPFDTRTLSVRGSKLPLSYNFYPPPQSTLNCSLALNLASDTLYIDMAGKKRSKSDAQRPLPPLREHKRTTSDIPPPVSPIVSRREIKETVLEEPSKSPEEWVEFASTKIWEYGKPPDAVRFLHMQREPDLLEFLITANEDIREVVRQAVCSGWFPDTRSAWPDSLSHALLDRFRHYFNRLPPSLVDRQVTDACRIIPSFLVALGALDHFAFETSPSTKADPEEEDPFFKKKKTQKQRKTAGTRARTNTTVVDPKIFMAIDFDVPTNSDELSVAETCILNRLRELLETLLDSFNNPELAAHARALVSKAPLQHIQESANPLASPTSHPNATNATSITNAPDDSAFPHIRPIGAAKYFDNASELGAWTVVVSGRAVAHLRQMQKGDSHVFAMVRKKITELSQGFFSDSNQKRLIGLDTEVPIYEAKVSRDLRIVYQIDLDTDVDAKRRGKEYRRRCLNRATPRAPGQNVTLPAQFPHEEDFEIPLEVATNDAPQLEGMTDKDFLDLHSLIALEKFIPMSQTLINSILNDSDASHVFHVSPKEKEIIYHPSACFVLGRSGTGKTTSIVFKMIGIEKLFEQMQEVTKPRQVFVTQSRVLAQRVQEYYEGLVSTTSSAPSRPSHQEDEQFLADLDDEDAGAFGLPPKYSMLEDKHFPLFLTYDQLCSLLEADFGLQFRRSARTKAHIAAEQRFAIQEVADEKINLDQQDDVEQPGDADAGNLSPVDSREDLERARRAAVTFDVTHRDRIFVAAYWPHFDYRLTKGFDPALIYSEFLGIIEGSEAALQSKTGALSREEYTSLSHRKSSFASQQDRVYDLYEIYRKRKQTYGGYDAAERTHALISAMNGKVPGVKLDCLYVDEAQDNLLIDIKLLHSLSNNPHGIFMAGDTAQTISAGSSFRFEDLSAFLWRLEEQDDAVRCGKRNPIHPTLFHLAVNYRSHGGIVDCASSVVQLISDLFPYSIDKLNKETGLIDGPKPIFFSGWDRGVVRFEQFLRGEADTKIDFGASQVILVRNEAAREDLRAQVGEIGLILTLYESKGLEFDDVLLYNFFEDSTPAASTWRVILRELQGFSTGSVPRFDEIRHAVICTELKNLYVGLTRARNHCWIWDVSEKAEPMKTFWSKKGLVTLCGPEDPMPQLSVSSSEADWAKSGRLLFNKRLYPQAVFCFEKAGLPLERDIAAAYQARKEARLLLAKSVDRQTLRNSFTKAATDFLNCAAQSKGKQQNSCYLRAAECFLQAEEWKRSAEAFLQAEEYNLAIKNFRRAGCFAEAVNIVKKHKSKIQKGLADEIVGVARLEFLRKSRYEQAAELFEDVEEQLEYMDDFGFDAARIHVLEHHKRYADAAEVAFKERNLLECIRLLSASSEKIHRDQALAHAIRGLWLTMPYGSTESQLSNPAAFSLLEYVTSLDLTSLDESARRQLELFLASSAKKVDKIVSLAQSNAILGRSSEALLCFGHCSRNLVALQNVTLPTFIANSALALSYYNGLAALIRTFDPTSQSTQRLLGFEPVESDISSDSPEEKTSAVSEFWLFSSSLMFGSVKSVVGDVEPTPFALGLTAVMLSELDITRLATKTMLHKLKSEIQGMHSVSSTVRYIQPCLDFAIFGSCRLANCGRNELNSFRLSNEDRQLRFNERLRAHIVQILIIHQYQAQTTIEDKSYKWTWARRLYETLSPHFPPLGNVLCVEPLKIRELDRASGVIANWCERYLHEFSPGRPPLPRWFVSDVLVALELAYRVNPQSLASYGSRLHSMPLVKWHPELEVHVPGAPGKDRSIIHHLIEFYMGYSTDALKRVIFATYHIVFKPLFIEANVLVHLLEAVGREMIVQVRRWNSGVPGIFDGLFLPQSWALDIVKHPLRSPQTDCELKVFFDVLYKSLEYMRTYEPGGDGRPSNSTLFGFHTALSILQRGVFILRICRILILVAMNLGFTTQAKNAMRIAIARALVGPGVIHNKLCVQFARADSWGHLESALIRSPLNRGADQLVHTLHRSKKFPHTSAYIKQISYNEIKPDLENLLSLTGTRGTVLNPEAKPFMQSQQRPEPSGSNPLPVSGETATEDVETLDEDPGNSVTDTFAELIPSQINYLAAAPQAQIARILTIEEIDAGKRILFCYRKYNFRQRVAAWFAVRTIWSYYSRYRLRTKVPHTANDEQIRKFHHEYKKEAEGIECPLLYAKAFRRHEQILLGPMPHVLLYLRGLERIVQKQKDSNKKRLQKVQHEELERVQAKMNSCRELTKKLKKLTPKISPGHSEPNLLQNINTLRGMVQEVNSLRSDIIEAFGENSIPFDLEQHYQLGVHTILTPSAEPKPVNPPKPELNISDLGDDMY
ncbi:UvrD-like helicase carboxy-terminal domain protein [Ceratobasidium sp. AG-Ba]|nr:UvrD-like helicase carboxy-terminal domain protein [Ceratobasidium sp. AG-Ba]